MNIGWSISFCTASQLKFTWEAAAHLSGCLYATQAAADRIFIRKWSKTFMLGLILLSVPLTKALAKKTEVDPWVLKCRCLLTVCVQYIGWAICRGSFSSQCIGLWVLRFLSKFKNWKKNRFLDEIWKPYSILQSSLLSTGFYTTCFYCNMYCDSLWCVMFKYWFQISDL